MPKYPDVFSSRLPIKGSPVPSNSGPSLSTKTAKNDDSKVALTAAVLVSRVINVGEPYSSPPVRPHPSTPVRTQPAESKRMFPDFTWSDEPRDSQRTELDKKAMERLPMIIDMIEEQMRSKLDKTYVRGWKISEVADRRVKIADEIINKMGERLKLTIPDESEDPEMKMFRMFFSEKYPLLRDYLSYKIDEMVLDVIAETRGSRELTIPDGRIVKPHFSDIANIAGPLIMSQLSPSESNKIVSNNDHSTLFDSNTSELDDLWEEPVQNIGVPKNDLAMRALAMARDEDWDVLTKDDILSIDDPPATKDSLAPVVMFRNDQYEEFNDADNDNGLEKGELVTILRPAANIVMKYRVWVSAAVLALLAGGSTVILNSANRSGLSNNSAASVTAMTERDDIDTIKKNKIGRPLAKTQQVVEASKISSPKPVLSLKTRQSIENIPDQKMRNVFKTMLQDGKFSFDKTESNTVNQLMSPFYRIANQAQKQQLDRLASNFNTGLFASATKRFGGLSETEKNKLLNDKSGINTDASVYRTLRNTKYGDPANWNADHQGKKYSDVFHAEMNFYERFEREMVQLSGCERVFQSVPNSVVPVYDTSGGRFNVVIEESAKIIFGTDFYSIEKPMHAKNADTDIPVYWDLDGFMENTK